MSIKRIVFDPGHGYHTPGKRTPDDIREWSMNSSVTIKAIEMLKNYKNVETMRTDDPSGDTDVTLANRMEFVNSLNPLPDMFISVHHNANTGSWGSWTGTEVYAHPASPEIDKTLATKFANSLSKKTGLKNRGKKEADFYVLRNCNSQVPAVLCEGGFMDSTIDHPVITSDLGQQQYAEALVEVIVEYLNLIPKDENEESYNMEDNPIHDSRQYFTNGQNNKPYIKVIGTEMLNVRSGRGTSFSRIGYLPVGSVVQANYILEEYENGPLWASITHNGQTGYIHLGFCVPTEEPDNTPPVITLNGDINITLVRYQPYVELGATAFDSKDGPVNVIIDNSSVNTAELGIFTVKYTAVNSQNNKSEITRTVIVEEDTTPPIIELKGLSYMTVEYGTVFEDPGIIVSDNSMVEPKITITGTVDTSVLGFHYIYYSAEDKSGWISTVNRTILVVDTLKPEIILNGSDYIEIYEGEEYIELGARAYDNVNGEVEVEISGFVNNMLPNTYYIYYTAMDESDNINMVIRTVVVKKLEYVEEKYPVGYFAKSVIVNTETTNIHSAPSFSSKVNGYLIHNEIVKVHNIHYDEFTNEESENHWGVVITNCKVGYINLQDCEEI